MAMGMQAERMASLEREFRSTLEALEIAASLGDFQGHIDTFESPRAICREMCVRVERILPCHALAVFLVDEAGSDFVLTHAAGPERRAWFEEEMDRQVERGAFARTLNDSRPQFVRAEMDGNGGALLLMHAVATGSRIRGMFMALPKETGKPVPESSLHLLSLVLLNTANCLESFELYGLLRQANERLRARVGDLERQSAFYHQLFESSPLALALVDTQDRIMEINTGYEQLFGYSREEAVGKLNRDLIVPGNSGASLFESIISSHCEVAGETVRLTKDRREVPVSVLGYPVLVGGEIEAVYFSYQDISERKAYEDRLAHQAFHDPLTDLPNRALFLDRMEQALKRNKRNPAYRFAVLLIDLDRFKNVNDSLGHVVGDILLQEISLRFQSCVREMDTVARLGGDEFAVLIEEFTLPREVVMIVNRLTHSLFDPFFIEGNVVHAGASIGVVIRTMDYSAPENILRDADIAMYRAKESGDEFRIFNKAMYRETIRAMTLENELRQALARDEFQLFYQPVINVAEQVLEGFEALLRWNHPRKGLVLPQEFIGVAEEIGLIHALGEWVFERACSRLKAWEGNWEACPGLSMSINMSALHISRRGLPGVLESILSHTGVDPQRIKLEITESALMRNIQQSQTLMARVKQIGLKLVIDDFGTGYSSLAYLQSFPIDALKIDRSFVSGSGSGRMNKEIVAAVLALAHNLGMEAVAEGVESPEQYHVLCKLGCGLAQGHLFAPALPAEEAVMFPYAYDLVEEAGPVTTALSQGRRQ